MSNDEVQGLAHRVLRRVGFDDMMRASNTGRVASGQGPSADAPRLLELQQLYASCPSNAAWHALWTKEYVHREVQLRNFRSESGFMWQMRDANTPAAYLATYLHLHCSSYSDLLNACDEDIAFGPIFIEAFGETITRDRLDSVSELGFLRASLGWSAATRATVLDIGSGYGRFAWRLLQCFPSVHVICADVIPEATFLCEYYLRYRRVIDRAHVCELPTLRAELLSRHVDVAVAINSLTECSALAVEWWVELISDLNIKHVFIVPPSSYNGGRDLYSFGRSCRLHEVLRRHGYILASKERKYSDHAVQRLGISPTFYHLYAKTE